MSDWLDASQKARKELRDAVEGLVDLSESLRHVGQETLAKLIVLHAYAVSNAEGTLRIAIGEAVDEIAASSRQATVNLAASALSVLRAAAKIETLSVQDVDPEERTNV